MVRVVINESKIRQALAGLEKQIRFATAQALTKTAQAAQEEVRRQLPERFTIRTGWVSKGIRIIPATPRKLETTVLVKDSFMAQQERGGEKVSPFGDALGVPVGARPSRTAVTRPSRFPGALLRKRGYFIAPIAEGSRTMGVWKRTGKGRNERLTLMYVFAKQVRLKRRFGFKETVNRKVLERFPMLMREAMVKALSTARL